MLGMYTYFFYNLKRESCKQRQISFSTWNIIIILYLCKSTCNANETV
jgi:hypothetical protein